MAATGQNRQCCGRAQHFRFVPKARHLRVNEYMPFYNGPGDVNPHSPDKALSFGAACAIQI